MSFQIKDIVALAEKAGEVVMHYYDAGDFEIKLKADKSPVTDADMASHRLITTRLREISDYPILSEEAPFDYSTRKQWSYFWLVDPLDGTKDFIKRTGDFTINIALINECRPVLGVIAIPAQKIIYFAEEGRGAYKKIDEKTEKITASLNHTPLRCAVSRFHCSDETLDFCKRNSIVEMHGYGSALKMCKIADGEVDVYPRLSPTMEWDIAAGHAILNEAGGKIISDKTGEPLIYNKESLYNDSFVASRKDLTFV